LDRAPHTGNNFEYNTGGAMEVLYEQQHGAPPLPPTGGHDLERRAANSPSRCRALLGHRRPIRPQIAKGPCDTWIGETPGSLHEHTDHRPEVILAVQGARKGLETMILGFVDQRLCKPNAITALLADNEDKLPRRTSLYECPELASFFETVGRMRHMKGQLAQ
jgi:hypothetical protein